ncbi:DUF4240 domain-containing protein [Actinokineospora bangkokensis]|uniref:DUF4240 domain-containing protein n=1 Tax=Actinokineospora bangkokensis TaxID=1193682 RepID=A0A1Q9LI98_9PSEU|nr:DUF4240 domain-containing protein [Actinokineospora bangkokensis]OLR91758.1 hypothetical protein BJP25_24845 [Actinokineospora bangkokensis]
MTDEAFWQLIGRAVEQPGDRDERAEWLTEELTRLPRAQVVDFATRLAAVRCRADTPALAAAARLIHAGQCSEDAFRSFQLWLLTLGRDRFDTVVADPDALADLPEVQALAARPVREWSAQDWPEWESLDYAAHEAWAEGGGGEYGLEQELPGGSGTVSAQAPVPVELPRLAALFGG